MQPPDGWKPFNDDQIFHLAAQAMKVVHENRLAKFVDDSVAPPFSRKAVLRLFVVKLLIVNEAAGVGHETTNGIVNRNGDPTLHESAGTKSETEMCNCLGRKSPAGKIRMRGIDVEFKVYWLVYQPRRLR